MVEQRAVIDIKIKDSDFFLLKGIPTVIVKYDIF